MMMSSFNSSMNKTVVAVKALLFCSLAFSAVQVYNFSQRGEDESRESRRSLSIDHGNGTCTWTPAVDLDNSTDPYGTLIAAYPSSGMRFVWQQVEGITGIAVQDDFFAISKDATKFGIVKTQYPHIEGIWSYGNNMDQVILLVRNFRWAFPSYHTLLSEINYAHTWEQAYNYLDNIFTQRPAFGEWVKFRDYLFDHEVKLWKWMIDFHMEGGTKYWEDLDFERNGQFPFSYLNDTQIAAEPKDENCNGNLNCVASAVISYERMFNQSTGVEQLRTIANTMRGKQLMNIPDDDIIPCMYLDTIISAPEPRNEDRAGPAREEYIFTMQQLNDILAMKTEVRSKYSSGAWANNAQAQDLVSYLDEYIDELNDEIATYNGNPPPTPGPDPNYFPDLVDWYQTLGAEGNETYGKGGRYNKAKVQQMAGYWPSVQHLYP